MPNGNLEHANVTVNDPERSAALLIDLLGWHIRWRGPAEKGGETVHVGNDANYVSFYTDGTQRPRYSKGQPLNHLAFTVDDLAAAEQVVIAAGLTPYGHDDYDPGRRFYFFDWDGVEYELVSYS